MTIYNYKALNEQGKIVRGRVSAINEGELEAKLTQSSLDLISAAKQKDSLISFAPKITLKEVILVCVHIHQLENSGVPILESISELRDNATNPTLKDIMIDVYDSLKNGKVLSECLGAHPKAFDNVFVSLVAAGEKTGNFGIIFAHLEHHLKWVLDIRSKVKKATYYPIFLFFLMSSVIMIMMVFVIPKLTTFLISQNIPLPFYTKALIATSNFVVNSWYFLVSIPVIVFFLIKFLCRKYHSAAYQRDLIMLNLPIIGKIIRKIELSRFCHFFAITYKSGMGIIECLATAGNVVQNLVIKTNIEAARTAVSEGQKLSQALKNAGNFPSLVVRMFKVGEDSGNLDKSLENVNQFYDQEIADSVNNLVAVLQPALTGIMGGLLMWITMSVFGPIYGSFGAVK